MAVATWEPGKGPGDDGVRLVRVEVLGPSGEVTNTGRTYPSMAPQAIHDMQVSFSPAPAPPLNTYNTVTCWDGSVVAAANLCPIPAHADGGNIDVGSGGSGGSYVPYPTNPNSGSGSTAPAHLPVKILGLSPIGKWAIIGLGILGGIAAASSFLKHDHARDPE